MHEISLLRSRLAGLAGGFVVCLLGIFGSAHFAHAAALTSTNVQPASLVAGSSTTVTVSFTTATNLPNNGKIKVTFPSNFYVDSLGGPVVCTGFDGGVTAGFSGQVVTITRNATGATAVAPAAISCTLPTISNPRFAGSTGTYTITTTDNSDVTIDTDASVAADTIVAAALTSTNVQPSVLLTNRLSTVTVSFTTVNSLDNNAKIKVTFPSRYNVTGAASGTCSTMDGSFATSVSGQVVTLTRSGGTSEPAGAQTCTISNVRTPIISGSAGTYTITTTTSSDATHDTDTAVTADNFVSPSDESEEDVVLTYELSVTSPQEGDVLVPETFSQITWESEGTGTMSYVNLSYSLDGGLNWTSIVTNERNDGSYSWMVPSASSDEVLVKVEGTDLETVLGTGESEMVSIETTASDDDSSNTADTSDDASDDTSDTTDTSSDDSAGDTSAMGGDLPAGTFVRGEDSDVVYEIGTDGYRHPFLDSQTFFTYAENFDDVEVLSASDLADYRVGSPMLPKAGTVLVKVQSVNSVYALEDVDGVATLRWISSESLANALYGSSWSSYVIDVPVTAWSHFEVGDDVVSEDDLSVDTADMLTREEVNSR